MDIPNEYGIATMHLSQADGVGDISFTHGIKWNSPAGEADDRAEAIYSYWVTGSSPYIAGSMGAGWTFLGVSVLGRLVSGILEAGTHYVSIAGTATLPDTLVPAYTPHVVTKRTGNAGVQYRGRMYPPVTGLDTSNVSPLGVIDSAQMPSQAARFAAVFTLWVANPDVYPVLLHDVPKGGGTAPVPTQVTSWQLQNTLGTQRRRKNRA